MWAVRLGEIIRLSRLLKEKDKAITQNAQRIEAIRRSAPAGIWPHVEDSPNQPDVEVATPRDGDDDDDGDASTESMSHLGPRTLWGHNLKRRAERIVVVESAFVSQSGKDDEEAAFEYEPDFDVESDS